MPLASMFILFESIVHNPTCSEAKENLLFLDIASGYFGRLEYESGGSLRGSIFSEFTLLAREFLRQEQSTMQLVDSDAVAESTTAAPPHTPSVDVNNGGESGVLLLDAVRSAVLIPNCTPYHRFVEANEKKL
jgi:hypothetical protein